MKIRLGLRQGSFTLAMVIIVATITVVVVGGYMVYKMQRRVNELNNKRLQELTNNINDFSASVLATNPVGSFALTSITLATQQVSVPVTWVVETSTNLVDWETVLVTQDPAEADNTVGTNLEAAPEPMRFFRTWSR